MIAWQNLRYGWVALAGITFTGATLFVADSLCHRATARDIIEVVLGTYERCLATQYATNSAGAPLYYVTPADYVKAGVTNSYDPIVTTNGAIVTTNWVAVPHGIVLTNAITGRIDRDMLGGLDGTIKALVPHYRDEDATNSTLPLNWETMTVTGLWSKLKVGDYGLHQDVYSNADYIFSNVVSLEKINGLWVVVTNSQAVKTNWTILTNEYNGSEFTSIPTKGTNATTYGGLPWRIYPAHLLERYKALNAMRSTTRAVHVRGHRISSSYILKKLDHEWNGWDVESIRGTVESHFNLMLSEARADPAYTTNCMTGEDWGGERGWWYQWSCVPIDELASPSSFYYNGANASDYTLNFGVLHWAQYVLQLDRIFVDDSASPAEIPAQFSLYVYATGSKEEWPTNQWTIGDTEFLHLGHVSSPLLFPDQRPAWPSNWWSTINIFPVFDWQFAYCTTKFW